MALMWVMLTLPCTTLSARDGKGWQKFLDGYYRFDGAIRKFLMGGMDSTYISLPATSFEIPLAGYVYGFDTQITPHNMSPMDINSHAIGDIGIGFGYHGLDLIYTQTLNSKNQYFEFDYYDNYWGLAIRTGNEFFDATGNGANDIFTHTTFLNGYVAVMGKRYSYPSVCYGNFIQKRSAGSPLISFWYEFRTFKSQSDWAQNFIFGPDSDIMRIHTGALTAGYGYNFAFAQGRFVLNMSACIGLMFPIGLASTANIGAMFWINEHFRINFALNNFFQKSWREKDMMMRNNIWRGNIAVVYCFGK